MSKRPIPKELQDLQKYVRWMDTVFHIPGTKITFGIDPLLNLIPYGGTAVSYAISVYLLYAMHKNGASSKVMGKMIANVTFDALAGMIPVLGTVFDFYYKANQRNMILAVEHFEENKHQGSILPYLILIFIVFILILGISIAATVYVVNLLFGFLSGISL
jgi:hypothetical protein